jgi:6-pyruvoyltetrahydropterin/6-carboxytetrahydropterin synthase
MGSSLTRFVGFTARHRYFKPDWSPEKNRATFGECTAEPGHAHDYRCTVTVGGEIDPVTGMVMDLGLLDRILAEEVTGPLHGKHFNLDVAAFGYGKTVPTCEAIADYLHHRIARQLPAGVRLIRIRIAEDESLSGEWAES